MRLIDADALVPLIIPKAEEYSKSIGSRLNFSNRMLVGEIKILVENAPTVDPVIRCKNCVHCADDWINVGMGTMPQFTCELGHYGGSVEPDWYCALGEEDED